MKSGTIDGSMAKKQTRRSISVSTVLYEQLRRHCDERNLSMSGFVEDRIREYLGMSEVTSRPRARGDSRSSLPVPLRPAGTPTVPDRRVTIVTAAEARRAIEHPPVFFKKTEREAPKPPALPPSKIFTF